MDEQQKKENVQGESKCRVLDIKAECVAAGASPLSMVDPEPVRRVRAIIVRGEDLATKQPLFLRSRIGNILDNDTCKTIFDLDPDRLEDLAERAKHKIISNSKKLFGQKVKLKDDEAEAQMLEFLMDVLVDATNLMYERSQRKFWLVEIERMLKIQRGDKIYYNPVHQSGTVPTTWEELDKSRKTGVSVGVPMYNIGSWRVLEDQYDQTIMKKPVKALPVKTEDHHHG